MNNKTKFKGPAYYEEVDANIFYGRDEETQDLFRLVMHSDFSVCYAESGEGKSSLINAGLLPVMRKNGLLPIRISFNDFDMNCESGDSAACDFDKIVLDQIDNEIAEQNEKDKNNHIEFFKIMPCVNQEDLDKKAWWRLRFMEIRRNHYECLIPVIIIDQFEEFFTRARSINWIDDFFGWLEDLYNNVSHTPGMEGVSAAKRFKVLLSLRSDYVCELDYWGMTKHFIPSLKNNRYCLKALTKKAAREIARQLSGLSEESYENIIKSAKSSQIGDWDSIKDGLPCVSALALSLILTGLSEDDSSSNVVTEYSDGEQTIRKILEMFCEKVWKECNVSAGHQYIIERALINEQGHRQLVRVEDESLHKIRFSELYLKKLTQTRLLRENNGYIELAHDSLCEIISNDVNEYEMQQKLERGRKAYQISSLLFLLLLVLVCVLSLSFIAPQRTSINKWANPILRYAIFNDNRIWSQKDVEDAGGIIGSTTLWCDSDNISVNNDCHIEKLIVNSSHPKFLSLSNCPNLREITFTNHVQDVHTQCYCGGLNDYLTINIGDSVSYFTGQLFYDQKKIHFNLSPNNKYFQVGEARESVGLGFKEDLLEVLWEKTTKVILYIEGLSRFNPRIRLPEELNDKISHYTPQYLQFVDTSNIMLSELSAYAGASIDAFEVSDNDSVIGEYAFMNCKKLCKVNLKNVYSIRREAFAYCDNLESVNLSKVKNVNLAFLDCKNLFQVVFPNDYMEIGVCTFDGCCNLLEISLPKVIKLDPEATFRRCTNLHSVFLPDSIIANDFYAPCYANLPKMFGLCYNLKEISFSENSHFNWREDSVLYYDDYPAIINCCTNPNWASKDSTFYFEKGILYMRENDESANNSNKKNRIFVGVFNDQRISNGIYPPVAFSRRSHFYFEPMIGAEGSYPFLLSSNDTIIKDSKFPLHSGTFTIINRSTDIKEIHLPYAEPKMVGLDFSQSTLQKEQIILYVPYLSRTAYLGDPRFRDFNNIIEESFYTSMFRIIKDDARLFFSILSETELAFLPGISRWYPIIASLIFLTLLICLCCMIFSKRKEWEPIFVLIFFSALSWYVFYWISFHSIANHLIIESYLECVVASSICSLVITFILALITIRPVFLLSHDK